MKTKQLERLALKNKNILITGGLGFVGSNLAQALVRLGANVTIYDCLEPRSGGNLENIKEIHGKVKVILNDIRNFDSLSASIKDKDIVFNCAAFTSHPNSMKEPWMDLDVNCTGVINLLEAARRYNKKVKIVHVGTSSQIGRMKFSPVNEDHPEFPLDIYSANKTAAEKYVLIYANVYKIPAVVIRIPNVYGPRSNIKSGEFGFINYFIGQAIKNKSITVYGSGRQLRSLLYIEDCVKALILAALNKKCEGEVLFASGAHQISVIRVAQQILKIFGKGKIKNIPWPPERKSIEIGDAVLSNKKIKRILGWCPEWELEQGLQETYQFYSRRAVYYLP